MIDRELVNNFKAALGGFVPLLIVAAIVMAGLLSVVGYILVSDKNSSKHVVTPISTHAVEPGLGGSAPSEQLTLVTPVDQAPVQPTSQVSAPVKKPTATPVATPKPTPTPQPAPQYNASFSANGCMATVQGQPGTKVILGAFNGSKGGESRLIIPGSGTFTESASGILGMTSFVKILAADGTELLYKTSTIAESKCPPAGVSVW